MAEQSEQATPEPPGTSGSSRLISATAIMAAGTGVSRVLGFAKAALLVIVLGNGTRQADMFAFANVVPQAIYLLLAGGVLNTVFVPQIVRAMQEDDDGGEAYTNRLITLGMSAIGLIAIAATFLAPAIMGIYLDSKWKVPALAPQYDSIIMLAYFCMPQIFFYGMTVMLGQVLNARGKFGPMMWAPVLNNVVGIGAIVLFMVIWHGNLNTGGAFSLHQIMVLGLGATLGIVAQSLVLIPYIRSIGFHFRPRFDFRNSGLGRAGQVAKWTVGYMIVTQLALIVVSRLASRAVPSGGVGAGWNVYQNANLIFMLPHSLITVSLVTAMLPETSRMVVDGRLGAARDEVVRTMRLAITALLPASVAFLALAFPISQVLLGNGKGSAHWEFIAWTLLAFAIGLVPFTLQYVCLRAFYALEDTRTTFFVQILIAGVNVIAALLLVLPVNKPDWVAPGLALAYSLAYVIGLGISFHLLGKHLPGLRGGEIARHCIRVFVAVAPAGIVAFAISWGFAQWSTGFLPRVLALAVAGVAAIGIYFGMARALHIDEINQIVATVLRRRSRSGTRGGSDRLNDTDPSDNDSTADGGSLPGELAPSGTIGSGVSGDDANGGTDSGTQGGNGPDEAGTDDGEEASIVTQIRRSSYHPAGQQMTGAESEQAHQGAEAGAPLPPSPNGPNQPPPFRWGPLDAGSIGAETIDAETTASFTLAELVASGNEGTADGDRHTPADAPSADNPDPNNPSDGPDPNNPDPNNPDPNNPDPDNSADDTAGQAVAAALPDHLPAGSVLADRYRLEELLAWTTGPADTDADSAIGESGAVTAGTVTSGTVTSGRGVDNAPHGAAFIWRAFDMVLSRSVVIHLLPVGDERSDALLAAGRRAAGATDSRFLRVLDAIGEGEVAADGQPVGSYIVSEYAEGQSLESVLAAAPLTGLESAWVIREVADALSGAHARGLYHRRLNPDTVVITPAGNVKIVGLLIEASLRPSEYVGGPTGTDARQAADVNDLGRLLYACLVARWPGPQAAYGMAPAPAAPGAAQDSGHPWLTPRQVRHGVSPALDRICDQLLSPIPRQRAPRIVTAAELVGELDRVLGSADATNDLERRMRHPQPRMFGEEDTGAILAGSAPEPPVALVERNASIAAGTNSGTTLSSPSPGGPDTVVVDEPERPKPGPNRWIWLIVIAALIAAVIVTIVTAHGLGPNAGKHPSNHPSSPAASSPAAPRQLKIVGGKDFDPPPGNGSEHPGEVKYAFDGNPKTRWTTMAYYGSPKLGNLKPGVGIVLDLGSVQTVGSVKLQLSGDGTNVEIKVPAGGADAAPDMNSDKPWRTVASENGIAASGTATLKDAVQTRYVLVFLTSLPKEGANYRGGIYEVEVES